MRKKSYLSFKDLRVFYDKKNDSIRLTSGDPELAVRGWSLTLNRDSKDERILREALIEAGIAPSEREIIQEQERTRAELQASIKQRPEHITVGEVRDVDVETAGYEQLAEDSEYQADQQARKRVRESAAKKQRAPLPHNDLQRRIPADRQDKGWIGPYIGHTTHVGLEPVFFNVHEAIGKRAPGMVITGRPGAGQEVGRRTIDLFSGQAGSGKSVAMSVMAQAFLEMHAENQHPEPALVAIDPEASGLVYSITGIAPRSITIEVSKRPGILNPYAIFEGLAERDELITAQLVQLLKAAKLGPISPDFRKIIKDCVFRAGQMFQPSLRSLLYILGQFDEKVMDLRDIIEHGPLAEALLPVGTPLETLGDEALIYTMMYESGTARPLTAPVHDWALGMLAARALRQVDLATEKDARPSMLIAENANRLVVNELVVDMMQAAVVKGTSLLLSQQDADPAVIRQLGQQVRTHYAFRQSYPQTIDGVLQLLGMKTNNFNRARIRNLRVGEALGLDVVDGKPWGLQFQPSKRLQAALSGNPLSMSDVSFTTVQTPGVQRWCNDTEGQLELISQVHQLLLKRRQQPELTREQFDLTLLTVVNMRELADFENGGLPEAMTLKKLGEIARQGRRYNVLLLVNGVEPKLP